MRHFILALALIVIFAMPAVSASEAAIDMALIEHGAEVYNANVENAPGVVKSLLGDETIEVEISKGGQISLVAGMQMKNAQVVEVTEGAPQDPSIVVKAEEGAIIRIFGAEDPVGVFQQARDKGEISIEGMTWGAKLKVTATLSSMTVLRFFADLITR